MPKFKVLAVRDRAADVFMRPFNSPSLGTAIRSFADFVNDGKQDSEVYRHPEDFDLYHLADFDDETGVYECLVKPKQIAIGKDMKIRE